MKTNIVLTGFMGTGKTAVGKRLAALLNKEFYDTDLEIETVTGMTIAQLYNKYGEVRLNSEEKLAINRLAQHENCVIATGGGVVLDNENIKLLSKNGIIICLSAKPDTIYDRIKRRNNRPLLKKGDIYSNILEMMAQREEMYKCADFYIDTSNLDFQEIIEKIMGFLADYQKKAGSERIES